MGTSPIHPTSRKSPESGALVRRFRAFFCPLAPESGEPEKYRRAIADLSTPPVESPQYGDLGASQGLLKQSPLHGLPTTLGILWGDVAHFGFDLIHR